LTENGEVIAWGNNDCGSDVRDICKPIKLQYFNVKKVIEISSGMYHSLALTTDGKVDSCGFNHHGQLGVLSYTSANKPLPIDMPRIFFKKKLCCKAFFINIRKWFYLCVW
jgi:alpha-tubulin suppressor-like RCC1 family protein